MKRGTAVMAGAAMLATPMLLLGISIALAQKGGKPQPPPASPGVIAFDRTLQRGGTSVPDIFTVQADGTGVVRLTDSRARGYECSFAPSWSPGGVRIAYIHGYGSAASGNDLWTMKPDGSDKRQLTFVALGIGTFAWSPDGQYIAFTLMFNGAGGTGRGLYLLGPMDPATHTPAAGCRTVCVALVPGGFNKVSWTPDLKPDTGYQGKLLFGLNTGVWSIRALDVAVSGTGGLTYDSVLAADPASWPVFLPGRYRCVVAQTPHGLRALSNTGRLIEVYEVALSYDGAGNPILTPSSPVVPYADDPYDEWQEGWSTDGSQIVFVGGQYRDVYKASVPADLNAIGDPEQLTFTPEVEQNPSWVPPAFVP